MALLPPYRPSRDQAPTHRGGVRRFARQLTAVVAAVVVGASLFVAAPAHAAPTVEELEAQIDKQWEQIEPTIEQYNKVRSQLKANKQKSADLQKKIEPLSLQSQLALNRVGAIAARYYKSGPSNELNALLTTGKPATLPEQLAILDRLAAHERAQIAGVIAVRDKYDAEKQKLDTLITVQTRQEADLAAKKKHIDAEIKRLQSLMPKSVVVTTKCPTVKGVVSAKAATAIRTACAQVGKPYVWGAAGPNSFDCSGLTQYAYKAAGIYLPHYTGDQWTKGRQVSQSEARPGDLVFFPSHVGLYLGNGLMVHAPREGKPVNVSPIKYMTLKGFRRVA